MLIVFAFETHSIGCEKDETLRPSWTKLVIEFEAFSLLEDFLFLTFSVERFWFIICPADIKQRFGILVGLHKS